MKYLRTFLLVLCLASWVRADEAPAKTATYRIGSFSADVTIPLGHRCMGILPTKSKSIADPLQVHGFVLLGPDAPIVLAAVDWCEIRNRSYDQWRDTLAAAANTQRERVLVSSLHQHDAPVIDAEAQDLLDQVGLKGELFDRTFHDDVLTRVSATVSQAVANAQPLTHLTFGQARVDRVASTRRVVLADGRVTFDRGSSTGSDRSLSEAAEGDIDPFLKTIGFWNGEKPLVAIHAYATHPMSHYGQGEVSADFVGLARELMRRDDPSIEQIYVSGCSGDVTAGKYNDGSPANRAVLAQRLYEAMKTATKNAKRIPIDQIEFRSTTFDIEFIEEPEFKTDALEATLKNTEAKEGDRILAAMSLSSRHRLERKQPIDLPCIDFGSTKIVLLPGEVFVGYQLLAQSLSKDAMIMTIGYGECWPGYVPTEAAFNDGFNHSWRWAARGSEQRIRAALERVLK